MQSVWERERRMLRQELAVSGPQKQLLRLLGKVVERESVSEMQVSSLAAGSETFSVSCVALACGTPCGWVCYEWETAVASVVKS